MAAILPEHLRSLFERYMTAYEAIADFGPVAPYRWASLPQPLSLKWLPYGQMLEEFSAELSNVLNDLSAHVCRLQAWAEVLDALDEDDIHRAAYEFISPVATVAVGLPYVIRNRFAFAAAHLCHQANRARDASWGDDLELDYEIKMAQAEQRGNGWRRWPRLKLKLEAINASQFKTGTQDFRSAYNHRFSPRFVVGHAQIVTRQLGLKGDVSYAFGSLPPLDLKTVAGLLTTERDRSHAAFAAFKALVDEHIGAIAGES